MAASNPCSFKKKSGARFSKQGQIHYFDRAAAFQAPLNQCLQALLSFLPSKLGV